MTASFSLLNNFWPQNCKNDFWEKTSLRVLGLEIQLGHCGLECDFPGTKKSLVVFDTNGFHLVEVVYCGCNHRIGGVAETESVTECTVVSSNDLGP